MISCHKFFQFISIFIENALKQGSVRDLEKSAPYSETNLKTS